MKSRRDVPLAGSTQDQIQMLQGDKLGALIRFNQQNGDIGRFGALYGPMVIVN